MRIQPALDSGVFAVLFFVTILGCDELRLERQDTDVPRRHNGRRKQGVIVFPLAVIAFSRLAVRAAEFLRGEIFGAIERNQHTSVEPSEKPQTPALLQHIERRAKQGKKCCRFDRIEHVADMIVGRDFVHAEQARAVRFAAPRFQRPLVAEERRALREEH